LVSRALKTLCKYLEMVKSEWGRNMYTVVFDVAEVGFRYWYTIVILVSLTALFVAGLLFGGKVLPRGFVPWVTIFFGGGTLIFGIIAGSMYSDYSECRKARLSGNYKVLEGIVEQFDPMPAHGLKDESFVVKGVRFKYSDFELSAGFNNTASHGGPLREGLKIRIFYLDLKTGRTILKLEMMKDQR
jgi:hypothetical protein